MPRSRYDQPPQYFVYGGLVFQTLTRDYLTTWDKWWNKAPKEFLNYYYLGYRTPEQHEVVILTQILADEINVGYAHLYNEAVATLNGKAPLDMVDFVQRAVDRARRRRDHDDLGRHDHARRRRGSQSDAAHPRALSHPARSHARPARLAARAGDAAGVGVSPSSRKRSRRARRYLSIDSVRALAVLLVGLVTGCGRGSALMRRA